VHAHLQTLHGTQPDSPARPAGIEELREKREALQAQVRDEELEKSKIQQDLQARARLRPRAQLGPRTCAADLASCAGRCSPSGCRTSTSRCSVRCAPHSALLLLAAAAPGTERMSNCCSGATQVSAREEYDKVIQVRRRPCAWRHTAHARLQSPAKPGRGRPSDSSSGLRAGDRVRLREDPGELPDAARDPEEGEREHCPEAAGRAARRGARQVAGEHACSSLPGRRPADATLCGESVR